DDRHVALRLLPQVEGREHPWQHEDRVRAHAEERSGHPAVRVRDLAEVRDLAGNARQVLEVGRGREEQRVDTLGGEALVEATATGGEVEHGATVSTDARC